MGNVSEPGLAFPNHRVGRYKKRKRKLVPENVPFSCMCLLFRNQPMSVSDLVPKAAPGLIPSQTN